MELKSKILRKFDELNIPYDVVFHQAVESMDQSLFIQRMLNVWAFKTFFLLGGDSRHYMILIDCRKKLKDVVNLSKLLRAVNLKATTPDDEWNLIKAFPGAESPLNLIFDENKEVTLLIDKDLMQLHQVAMLPCENHCSVKFDFQDFINIYLPCIGIKPIYF